MSRDNRQRRARRKKRNRERRETLLQDSIPRERGGSFSGKVRKGDVVEVDFEFDQGNPVAYQDEKDPSKDLSWMQRMMRRMQREQERKDAN